MGKNSECEVLLIGYEDEENLGLRYIAAFLGANGVKVGIEPYNRNSREAVLRRIQEEHPKMVGFSLIFQRMLFDFAELIAYLRGCGVKAHFTMGGHFPSIEFEETLRLIPELDTVVRHEGEQTLLELHQHLGNPEGWPQIRGIAYVENGTIRVTPPRPLIENLDALPFPAREGEFRTHMGLGMASILASRGCYYDCSFCSIRQFYSDAIGPRRRSRSPYNVADEMEALYKQGVRIFNFRDDDFGMRGSARQEWIEKFAGELENRGLCRDIIWRIACRVDEVDAETCGRLMEVGLAFIYLGIESGSNQGLKTFNKHYDVNEILRTLHVLNRAGLSIEYGFMFFDPDATFDSLKDNLALLGELGKGGRVPIHFTKMLPYVGTPIAKRLREEWRLKGSISSPDYNYSDARIELMEVFITKAFHKMLFEEGGLVNRLQFAQFNSVVLDRLFSHAYDSKAYIESLRRIIERCNDSTLHTISSAIEFMDSRGREDILREWLTLDNLAEEERVIQSRIENELNYMNPMEYWNYL